MARGPRRPELSPAIEARLADLDRLFDLDALAGAETDPSAIRRYYRATRWAYSRLHDSQNTLHVGLSRDGEVRPDDVFAQLEIIDEHLPTDASHVLELATGRGANAAWLAERHPGLTIEGIDLSPDQLDYARKAARGHPGYRPRQGDYHDLSATRAESIDLAFVIDALCYSERKGDVLAEVARVLRPGGLFLVFDGYAVRPAVEMAEPEARAAALLARGMAVPEFEAYERFQETAAAGPLQLWDETDLSAEVVPGVRRFERLAARYIKRPGLARMANAMLPKALTGNVVSGYLFATLLEAEVVSYWLTVLRKP